MRALAARGQEREHEINRLRGLVDEAALAAALQSGRLDIWLTCPMVSQYRVSERVAESLEVTFDIAVYATGTVKTDVIFRADFDGALDQPVAYTIRQRGRVVDEGAYTHWGQTVWRRTLWDGEPPTAAPRRDIAYAAATGATPRYDWSIVPDLTAPLKRAAKLDGAFLPMASPLNKHNMTATGQTSNRHVGLMTIDQVMYLLSQDPRLLPALAAYSHGGASLGLHRRDPATGTMTRQLPDGGLTAGIRRTGDWKPDQAHQPAFHYAPYLWTGERFYLDLLQHQANASLFDRAGRIILGQPRGTAWKLRNLCNAAYITPDADPLKDYFRGHLARTMAEWRADYIESDRFDVTGKIKGFHWRPNNRGTISPWQEDYLTMALGWCAEMGVPGARDILAWKANYTIQRFRDHPGWSAYSGVSYRHGLFKDGHFVGSFGEIFRKAEKGSGSQRPNRAGHYFDAAFGAAKTLDNVLATADTARTVAFLQSWASEAGGGIFAEWSANPKWAIRRRE